jgi:hypothetical protein
MAPITTKYLAMSAFVLLTLVTMSLDTNSRCEWHFRCFTLLFCYSEVSPSGNYLERVSETACWLVLIEFTFVNTLSFSLWKIQRQQRSLYCTLSELWNMLGLWQHARTQYAKWIKPAPIWDFCTKHTPDLIRDLNPSSRGLLSITLLPQPWNCPFCIVNNSCLWSIEGQNPHCMLLM